MDFSEIAQKYSLYLRQYFVPLILGLLGLIFLAYGMIWYFSAKKDKPDILLEAASDSVKIGTNVSPAKQDMKQKLITVDIEGAVEKPGVYRISSDSSVQDGLIAAGGLGSSADREIVAKNINLAAKLSDLMKVYIPFQGDKSIISDARVMAGEKMVNINSATTAEFDSLPGISKATADKIISNRPYESIEALFEKKVVGQRVFEQIKDKITAH